MARLKRHHLRTPPPLVYSDDEMSEDDAMDGGAEPHSPARSSSDSDILGMPPSPSISSFIVQPIRQPIFGEVSVGKSKRSSARSGSKRLSEEDDSEVETKKMKKNKKKKKKKKKKQLSSSAATITPTLVAGGGDQEIKRSSGAIQRIWSEEDEITILKGVIEFRVKTGSDPGTDWVAFLEFIRDSIHVDASKSQLMDKVRSLKKKFRANLRKFEKGVDPVFAKSHDLTVFELSKKIWGKAECDGEAMAHSNGTVWSRKRGKKEMSSDEKTPDSMKPLVLGLRKQDANGNKNGETANLESGNRDEPKKSRGGFEELADVAVAVAAAEFNSDREALDDKIDRVVEKLCNGNEYENGGSEEEAADDEIEMGLEKGFDGKENGGSDDEEYENGGSEEAVDDEIETGLEKGCDGKENGGSDDEAVGDETEMVVEKGYDGKENGGSSEANSNPEVVNGRIETVVDQVCNGKENVGSGEPELNHHEVVNGRNEMVVDNACQGKQNGGSCDTDVIRARYPYLQDAMESLVSQGVIGEIQKRLFVERVGGFEGRKWKEWDDKWEAFRFEEMQLLMKKHILMAEFAEAALDAMK